MRARRLSSPLFFLALAILALLPVTVSSNPDPCLVVYTTSPTVYHYDITEYYTVTVGHPLYDPLYDRGGEVLIDINSDEIPLDIYQAPNLIGFEPSTGGEEGYFSIGTEFDLVIDGWSNNPTTYVNIFLVFDPDPDWCTPVITVDGDPVTGDMYPIGDLVVSTPTPNGNNYSDTMIKHIVWSGCFGVRIWAFSDENDNGEMDGGECFSAFSHDLTIPVEQRSWGAIKNLYKD